MSKRDALARAMAEDAGFIFDDNETLSRKWWLQRVDAILAELREPDEGMLAAARDWSARKYGKPIGNDAAIGCLQTMLDAITTEKSDE